MDIPQVARYRIDRRRSRIDCWPVDDSHDEARRAFERWLIPLAAAHRGEPVLHASAVATAAGVVGFCGCSGVGKSTLAAALVAARAEPWSDDSLILGGAGMSSIRWCSGGVEERPLLRLFMLQRPPGSASFRAAALSPQEAIVALFRHLLEPGPAVAAVRRRELSHLAELVRTVPCYRLTLGDDRRKLKDFCAAGASPGGLLSADFAAASSESGSR